MKASAISFALLPPLLFGWELIIIFALIASSSLLAKLIEDAKFVDKGEQKEAPPVDQPAKQFN